MTGTGVTPGITFSTGQLFYIATSDPLGDALSMTGTNFQINSGGDLFLGARDYVLLNTGTIGSYIDIESDQDINIRTGIINLEAVSTICTGDFNVQTINGQPPGAGGGGFISTATGDLDMNNFRIYDILSLQGSNLGITATSNMTVNSGGSMNVQGNDIFISSLAHIYIDAFADIEIATAAGLTIDVINDIDILGSNTISIIGEGRYDLTTTSGGMTLDAHTEINLYAPVVNRELAPATTVIQPVIQHGLTTGNTAAAGYVQVTMSNDYNNTDYTVNVTAATNGQDIPSVGIPSFCAIPTSGTTFDCYWYNSSSSYDTIFYWSAFGYYTLPHT